MHRAVFWIICLLLVSTGVMAAPRTLIRDGSQIDLPVKDMGIPVSQESRHFDEAKPQSPTAETRTVFGLPSSGNDDTDAIAAGRFEATGKPRNRNRDILIPFSAKNHFDGKHVSARGLIIKRTGTGVDAPRNKAVIATKTMPSQIKLLLAQPTAPPVVVNNRGLASRQAL